ncbi:MAG TPA: chorismate mutase [Thermoanaerobaculia bacterium]|nr:chorismate mutase [Thermoanaerobaculia bacterium]
MWRSQLKIADETPRSELEALRRRIDDLNLRILDLAQERAAVVVEISRLKEELGLDSHDPEREEKMLRKLTRSTSGPFGPGEVREIFQALFRASLALQERDRRRTVHPLSAGGEAP